MAVSRIYLYPKDVQLITGNTIRASQKLYNLVRDSCNKKRWITITDWCKYNGDSETEIKRVLNIK